MASRVFLPSGKTRCQRDLCEQEKIELPAHRTAPPTAPKVAWVDGGYCDHKVGDLAPEDQQFSATKPISEVPTADRLRTGVGDIRSVAWGRWSRRFGVEATTRR